VTRSDVAPAPEEEPRHGPRGGRTTVSTSGGLVKKTIWLERDVEHHLREEAFDKRVSEAEIVREALRERYGLE
jgi:hypothetical protein